MNGGICSTERRGEEEQASGICGYLAVNGHRFRVLFFFSFCKHSTSKYGKIRLFSLLSFLMTNIKSKFKALESKLKNTSHGQQDIQETKEPRKLTTRGKKEGKFKRVSSNHKEPMEIYHIMKFCKD